MIPSSEIFTYLEVVTNTTIIHDILITCHSRDTTLPNSMSYSWPDMQPICNPFITSPAISLILRLRAHLLQMIAIRLNKQLLLFIN